MTETSPNSYAKSSIFKPSPWLPINCFPPRTRRRDSSKFAATTSPDSCLLTFTICFHLREGELHPSDSLAWPGCVGFGQVLSCFILHTGTALLYQLLNSTTPVHKLGLGAAEEPSSLLNYSRVTQWCRHDLMVYFSRVIWHDEEHVFSQLSMAPPGDQTDLWAKPLVRRWTPVCRNWSRLPILNEVASLRCWCIISFPLGKIYWKWFGVWFGFQNWWKVSISLFWKSVPYDSCLQQARKLQTQWHPHKDWENISAASWRLVQENMRHLGNNYNSHLHRTFQQGIKKHFANIIDHNSSLR